MVVGENMASNALIKSSSKTFSRAQLNPIESKESLVDVVSTQGNKEAQQAILNDFKGVKLSVDEQRFIKQFRELEELEREKSIRFFQCIGDAPH